jgi:hypothetical protein
MIVRTLLRSLIVVLALVFFWILGYIIWESAKVDPIYLKWKTLSEMV